MGRVKKIDPIAMASRVLPAPRVVLPASLHSEAVSKSTYGYAKSKWDHP